MQHASVYITCPDRDSARRIARTLLERRLIACANLSPVESLYWGDKKIEESVEVAMFCKTRKNLVPEVVRAVRELHPYEVPCAVAFELGDGEPTYYRWLEDETAPSRQRS